MIGFLSAHSVPVAFFPSKIWYSFHSLPRQHVLLERVIVANRMAKRPNKCRCHSLNVFIPEILFARRFFRRSILVLAITGALFVIPVLPSKIAFIRGSDADGLTLCVISESDSELTIVTVTDLMYFNIQFYERLRCAALDERTGCTSQTAVKFDKEWLISVIVGIHSDYAFMRLAAVDTF